MWRSSLGREPMLQQLRHGALGDVPAGVHDVHVVGQALRVVHQVGGENDPHPAVAELGDELEDQLAGLRVQAGARLIQEQHLRISGKGCGEGKALLLAAREPAHRAAAEAVDPEAVDQVPDRPGVPVHAGDVLQQRNGPGRRRQSAVLQHHADPRAQRRAGGIRVLAQQADRTRGPLLQALRAFDGGGLAGTVGPQQRRDLPAFGDEGKAADHPQHLAVQGRQWTYILDEPADGQDGGFGRSHQNILRDVVRPGRSGGGRSAGGPAVWKPCLTGRRD